MGNVAWRLFAEHPWAITAQALDALMEMARLRATTGLKADFLDGVPDAPARDNKAAGGVGVIPIRGTIKQHGGGSFFDFLFGSVSTDGISVQLRTFLADESVRAIVLDIDSPGGSTFGMTELAGEIMAARGKKPIIAVANSVAASGAYWIGSAADQFYATPGGLVGSIGVYMLHMDMSQAAAAEGVVPTFVSAGKNKLRGNEFAPLSDEDVTHFQAIVNDTYEAFVKDVARGRGVTPAAVRGGFGEGDVVPSSQAKKMGMVDGVMTLSAAIEKAQTLRSKAPSGMAAEAIDIEQQADAEGAQRLRFLRWQAQQSLAESARGNS